VVGTAPRLPMFVRTGTVMIWPGFILAERVDGFLG
jgi:hypothetical protein